MTPVQNAVPAAVFPGTTVPTTAAYDAFGEVMRDLLKISSIVDGARALVEEFEHKKSFDSLANARALLESGVQRISGAHEILDRAQTDEWRRAKGGDVSQPVQSDEPTPTPLAIFLDATCQRSGTIGSLIGSAMALLEKGDQDRRVFEACQVLKTAYGLADDLSGSPADFAFSLSKSRAQA